MKLKKIISFKCAVFSLVMGVAIIFIVLLALMKNENNSIEDYYSINKEFVDSFYDITSEEINYEKIDLNFKAYPLMETSMDIEVENIDLKKVDDIRPLLEAQYNILVSDGYTKEIDNIKTRQDYIDFMESQVMPEDMFILSKKIHHVLEDYKPGEMTYKEVHDLTREIKTWENSFTPDEIEYFKMRNITIDDALFLIQTLRSVENIKDNSDSEIIEILKDEYLYKQEVCKKYLALYSINKIYGDVNPNYFTENFE